LAKPKKFDSSPLKRRLLRGQPFIATSSSCWFQHVIYRLCPQGRGNKIERKAKEKVGATLNI